MKPLPILWSSHQSYESFINLRNFLCSYQSYEDKPRYYQSFTFLPILCKPKYPQFFMSLQKSARLLTPPSNIYLSSSKQDNEILQISLVPNLCNLI